MRTRIALLALSTFVASAGAASAAPVKRTFAPPPAQWVPGEIVVGFEEDASVDEKRAAHARRGAAVKKQIKGFRVDLVKLSSGRSVAAAVEAYREDPNVAFAEPNYIRYADATPTDPLFSDLWGLENDGSAHRVTGGGTASGSVDADIDAPAAWDTPSLLSPIVAVIDAGFNVEHPDLDGSLWTNPDPLAKDVHGWDFGQNRASLRSSYDSLSTRHGTHVAGTIAAEWGNDEGIAGVCRACQVMLLKIENKRGQMTIAAEIEALAYAQENGATIANMSFGGAFWSAAERAAIKRSDLLVVVAAGNESLDNDMYLGDDRNGDRVPDVFSPSYPSSYTLPNIVSVAASNHVDDYAYGTQCFARTDSRRKCAFTNWGHDSVDLAAPGVDVLSTALRDRYATMDGTSMAAPHVTGVAALLQSQVPTLTTPQLKNKILNSVEPGRLDRLASRLFNVKSGSFTLTDGRLDAAKAVGASTDPATPSSDGNVDGARRLKKSRTDRVAWPHDVNDVYKRMLYAGRTYRIRLNGPARRDLDLFLWQRGTKEIWQTNVGCPTYQCPRVSAGRTADESFTFKPKKTGVYYVHVSAWLKSRGSYTVSVRRV